MLKMPWMIPSKPINFTILFLIMYEREILTATQAGYWI